MITSGDGVQDDMRKELRSPQVRTGFLRDRVCTALTFFSCRIMTRSTASPPTYSLTVFRKKSTKKMKVVLSLWSGEQDWSGRWKLEGGTANQGSPKG